MLPSRFPILRNLLIAGGVLSAVFAGGCKSSSPTVGTFEALTTNISDGDIWALNRPIQIVFNSAINPASIGFASIIIRPTDAGGLGQPVTGTFELTADTSGRANRMIVFTPSCPTNAGNTNGGLVPGGNNYELVLPTLGNQGSSILRDTQGHQLATGLTRDFKTPEIGEALFADTIIGPPAFDTVEIPNSLGLLSQDMTEIVVTFNQSINPSPDNLALDRLHVQYSNAVGLFPTSGNIVAGDWLVVQNCGDGAVLHFRVSGVLLPSRSIRVVASSDFQDIGGATNTTAVTSLPVSMPTLAQLYADGPAFTETDVTVDEFRDEFQGPNGLDLDASLPQPTASVSPNLLSADFEFPGSAVATDENLVVTATQGLLTLTTDNGSHDFSDGNGRTFTITDGVLEVNDFTIESGATLRAAGDNPLIIYVAGEANLLGTLDASGFNAAAPDGGAYHPELPGPGAEGVCGGGDGGTSSQTIDSYTVRGETGNGPFGATFGGGQGGEGGFQQYTEFAATGGGAGRVTAQYIVAGGGGGGAFSLGRTDSVFWDQWSALENPLNFDDAGPDLRADRHTAFDGGTTLDEDAIFTGAEAGLRGSARGSGGAAAGPGAHGTHGYEDLLEDGDATDNDFFDPARTTANMSYDIGSLTNGPDGGLAGTSVFSDGDLSNDFYGNRFFWDGGVTDPVLVTGELMAPYAGSGGGASGDMQQLLRYIDDGTGMGIALPLIDHWPDPNFPNHGPATPAYYRGAPGGGGGGQVQIHALGAITLGPSTTLRVNGGAGHGGEASYEGTVSGTTTQVSGSGGGSGGHMILHTTTGLNVAAIDVGTAGDPGVPATFFDNLAGNHVVQAIGGRRGWAVSTASATFNNGGATNDTDLDGNGPYSTGRGGAGASGVIQVHVPNPLTDITYHPTVDAAFKQYISVEDLDNPPVSDRQDEILGLYTMPQAFTLVPFYSPESQLQSQWIDTGLAGLRTNSGAGTYPAYLDALLHFDGIDSDTGMVISSANKVVAGDTIGSDAGAGSATFSNYSVTIANPSNSFAAEFLRNPNLLVGFDVLPNAALGNASTFEIMEATYTASPETLVLTTRVSDGPMALLASASWVVKSKFFRVNTTDTKDRLPVSASVRIQFQGTDAITGTNDPDLSAKSEWTGDGGTTTLATLDGSRFIRYRLTFDIDALDSGPTVDKERPGIEYLKLPFAW
ncbi:MAG: hypothetical protein GY747_13365 [Planctomycetes bacterium]|nr:hypothetical protein [Planctomycetota bacterium]MCP4770721.1 hypothetical protein [Planctomycetota bacterium]MCP4861436.1 hypothetical protein [Planctomycetota bacterium]